MMQHFPNTRSTPLSQHLVWGVLLFVFLLTSTAHAYTRSKTSDGKDLFWATFPIEYHFHDQVASGLSKADTFAAFDKSFAAWSSQDCTCIHFKKGGVVSDNQLGYDQSAPDKNKNLLIFRTAKNSWTHERLAVAVTSTIFKKNNGEIVAFDIELNAEHFNFSLDGASVDGKPTMDVQNTITHEVGHVIGLDHSSNRSATMFAAGLPNETKKRKLHTDDIDGLCTIYPKGTTCSKPPSSGCGCQTSSKNIPWTPVLLLLLFAFLVHSVKRKNRHKASNKTI